MVKSLKIYFILFISLIYSYSAHSKNLENIKSILSNESYISLKEICDQTDNESAECLNNVGVYLILESLKLKNENNKNKLQTEAIDCLIQAKNKDNKEAIFNLAWAYAVGLGVKKDLDKSSELYRNAYKEKRVISENSKNKISKISDRQKQFEYNYSKVRTSLAIMEKIELFFFTKGKEGQRYLEKSEYELARSYLTEIIENSKINEVQLEKVKKEVGEEQKIILELIKIDIINYDVKHKQFAIDNLRKLEELKN